MMRGLHGGLLGDRMNRKNCLKSCSWLLALTRVGSILALEPSNVLHRTIRPVTSMSRHPNNYPFLKNHSRDQRNQFQGYISNPRGTFQASSRLFASQGRTKVERIMTEDALAIVRSAIKAVDPYTAIHNHMNVEGSQMTVAGSKTFELRDFDKAVVIAFGKASSAMATAVIQELTKNNNAELPIQGVVVVKDDHATEEERKFLESNNVLFREASHPVPDERSAFAAQEIMDMVSGSAHERTLVICCISGGGSALFCLPQDPLTLDDLKKTNSILLESGLSIQEINVLRKRLENGKGGRLASAAYPSTILSLVLSDVLGDPLDLIASGPTVPDTSTFEDAWSLVERNELQNKLPKSVVQLLLEGLNGHVQDSPSREDPVFQETRKCETIVVGNNEVAVAAAAKEAQRRGYDAKILGSRIEGEAKDIANFYASMAQHLVLQRDSGMPYTLAKLPAALIGGGETTVSIPEDCGGKGGRNQELALAASLKFRQLELQNVVLASIGTDGTDGPTDAAGAVVDGGTVQRIEGSAKDFLRRHDAYSYLDQEEPDGHSPLIRTGPTGTNVADVCVTLVK